MNEITLAKLREIPPGPPHSTKNIFIRDIERCPYVPKDPEYVEWMRKDDQRLDELSRARTALANTVNGYMSHEDRTVRQMAMFLDWFLEK